MALHLSKKSLNKSSLEIVPACSGVFSGNDGYDPSAPIPQRYWL